jgi:rhodanese-related sulfurtransferase
MMAGAMRNAIEAVSPADAWEALSGQRDAALVDVRTAAEWTFVGAPDLDGIGKQVAFIEWRRFPDMAENPRFTAMVDAAARAAGARTLFFICRSGARSHDAAESAAAYFSGRGEAVRCVNVLEGFEGGLDAAGRRGTVSGWKVRGLPWRQG